MSGREAAFWERERFLSDLAQPCPPVIDLTGPPRFVAFGPYVTLAPGCWRAKVILELCPEAARRRLAAQFGAEPDYATVALPAGVPGHHAIVIDHTFAAGDLAQARLWLQGAAFHGEVRFLGVEISPLPESPEGPCR